MRYWNKFLILQCYGLLDTIEGLFLYQNYDRYMMMTYVVQLKFTKWYVLQLLLEYTYITVCLHDTIILYNMQPVMKE